MGAEAAGGVRRAAQTRRKRRRRFGVSTLLLVHIDGPNLTPALQLALAAPRRLPGNALPMRGKVKGGSDDDSDISGVSEHLGDGRLPRGCRASAPTSAGNRRGALRASWSAGVRVGPLADASQPHRYRRLSGGVYDVFERRSAPRRVPLLNGVTRFRARERTPAGASVENGRAEPHPITGIWNPGAALPSSGHRDVTVFIRV